MIYYVEDDKNIRDLVLYTLKQTGFDAQGFSDAASFYRAWHQQLPRLVILDIMLPGEDGIAILKKLREDASSSKVPILMLTAKDTEFDKVIGLDSGADDYMTKPFGMMEFVARVKALLRRTEQVEEKGHATLTFEDIALNAGRHIVSVGGTPVSLTLKEFDLLHFLLIHKGMVLTRDQLLENVWGYEYSGGTRTVDVHIQTLRQKLGESGAAIETVRGVGYRIGA